MSNRGHNRNDQGRASRIILNGVSVARRLNYSRCFVRLVGCRYMEAACTNSLVATKAITSTHLDNDSERAWIFACPTSRPGRSCPRLLRRLVIEGEVMRRVRAPHVERIFGRLVARLPVLVDRDIVDVAGVF
jgi:hypothetical protein